MRCHTWTWLCLQAFYSCQWNSSKWCKQSLEKCLCIFTFSFRFLILQVDKSRLTCWRKRDCLEQNQVVLTKAFLYHPDPRWPNSWLHKCCSGVVCYTAVPDMIKNYVLYNFLSSILTKCLTYSEWSIHICCTEKHGRKILIYRKALFSPFFLPNIMTALTFSLPFTSEISGAKTVGTAVGIPAGTLRFEIHRQGSMASFLGQLPHARRAEQPSQSGSRSVGAQLCCHKLPRGRKKQWESAVSTT